jgi:hypothetical protein
MSSVVTAKSFSSMRSFSLRRSDLRENAASAVAESAVATVDHSDIRGPETA